jgi:hypothetical protein
MGVDFYPCSICKDVVHYDDLHNCVCGYSICSDCSGYDYENANNFEEVNYILNPNRAEDGNIFSKCPLCGIKKYTVEIDGKYAKLFEKLLDSKKYVTNWD